MNDIEDITLQVVTSLLWRTLVENGEFDLLNKLTVIDKYNIGTVIVPSGAKGFSYRDDIHNLVIQWLRLKGINVWNPESEILELERALHGQRNINP